MKRVVVGVVFGFLLFALAATSSATPARAPSCQGPGQECKASADCCGSLNCLASRNPAETSKLRCY